MNNEKTLSLINKMKQSIQESLSYTSQDFDSIVTEMLKIIKSNDLPVQWNNISETDPIMLLLVLVASHKDILNYMTDFKLREAFLETATQISSVIRHTKAYGYSVPGAVAGVAKYELELEEDDESTYVLPAFETFYDIGGTPWTFMGTRPKITPEETYSIESENASLSKDNNTIYLIQGSCGDNNQGFINALNYSKLIGPSNIAFSNAYDNSPVTYLYHKTKGKRFDQEIINQTTNKTPYIYELGLDVNEMSYIQFANNLNLNTYGDMQGYIFKYLITFGNLNITPADIKIKLLNIVIDENGESPVEEKEVTLVHIQNEYYVGKERLKIDEIKEDFKNYYASVNSLITVNDYANYILNIQKAVPNITKCLVLDSQYASNGEVPTPNSLFFDKVEEGAVAIYVYPLKGGDEAKLLEELKKYKVSGIKNYINTSGESDENPLEELVLKVNFPSVNIDIQELIKTKIKDYVLKLNIGGTVSESDIVNLLFENDLKKYFTDSYPKITLQLSSSEEPESFEEPKSLIKLAFNQCIVSIEFSQG